ncbi:MAG: M81 family metallopeptidase [Anaerorhabdus sp.]
MKVLVAYMSAECNEHIKHTVSIEEFNVYYDQKCIDEMDIRDIFEENEIEIVPSIYARINPNGMIEREAYDFIEEKMLSEIRLHLHEIDGIYLQFHGASGVLNLDRVSAEHHIIKKIRAIVGKYMPIAMVMDPHGNLTEELGSQLNIVRCYRESPHSDTVETRRKVAQLLVELLKEKRHIIPVIRKLPIMVGGERSVSAKEPMVTINKMLNEAEKDERVMSCSYHVGYIRHDDDTLGACVAVVPSFQKHQAYCEKVAEEISEYAWNHRHEFKFTSNHAEMVESVDLALDYAKKTVVITDSGDNCGAGGSGQNTEILRELLKRNQTKKILIAGINDKNAQEYLSKYAIGEKVNFDLGVDEDELSKSIPISGTVVALGQQQHGKKGPGIGMAITVNIENTNIDVVVVSYNVQYGTMEQFHAAGLEFHDYDIVVVKMGYLDTYLIPETSYHIMALTDGATIQRSEKIPFKKIHRPMWPIDEMEELEYIK